MRLYEIVRPPLHLRSASQLQIGTTMRFTGCATLGTEIEDMLEARRPADKMSRKTSYPLFRRPEPANYIYLVETNHFDRLHSGWLKLIEGLDTLLCEALDIYADRYWSGAECTEASEADWEYLTESVTIIKQTAGPRLHKIP